MAQSQKGIDIVQTGDSITFSALFQDYAGSLISAAGASLYLYEIQRDGTLKSYDFSSNTFKTTALTTESVTPAHQSGNNGTTITGIWTYLLSTVSGFTLNGIYLVRMRHTSALPVDQYKKFQYGGAEGDLVVSAAGALRATFYELVSTVLTESATGRLKAALTTLLDVASPVLTAASVNQTTDNNTILASGTYGLAALLTQLQNIQNNTFIATTIPQLLEKPDSGSVSVTITYTFADETGTAKNLDSGNPIVTLVNDAGTDLSSRLGAFSNPATGKYTQVYTNSTGDTIEGLHWDVTGTINSKLRRYVAYTQIVNTTAVDFTSTDRTNLGTILTQANKMLFDASNFIKSAPQTAGTLTSAYDAAKTAAQAGNQMDLVNAPNVTAITAIQSGLSTAAALAAFAGKFTGITSVTNWLRAMIRKSTADATALAEINTLAGTYLPATDSLEALSENVDSTLTVEEILEADTDGFDVGTVGNKLSLIGTYQIVVQQPIAAGGPLTLIAGDDYQEDDQRQLVFTNAEGNWPDLTDAEIEFTVRISGAATNLITSTDTGVVTPTGPGQSVKINLTGEDMTIPGGRDTAYVYFVRATLDSGNVVTLANDVLYIT